MARGKSLRDGHYSSLAVDHRQNLRKANHASCSLGEKQKLTSEEKHLVVVEPHGI